MENKKYEIIYLPAFINQFKTILSYITYNLKNKIAADKLYNEIIEQIEKRSENPLAFEIFKTTRNKEVNWYTIRVKDFTIFYVVEGNHMILSRIYYSKRNFDKLI